MRLRALVASTLVSVAAAFATPGTARAAPVLGLPDLTFTALAGGRTESGTFPVQIGASSFSMGVSSALLGDSMALDTGAGFSPVSATLLQSNTSGSTTAQGFSYAPGFTLQLGPGIMDGIGSSSFVLERTLVGFDGYGTIRVVVSALGSPWQVGQTLGLDLHVFDVQLHDTASGVSWTGDVKGELAPIVPEPASVALLGLGLVAVAARRRRALSAPRACPT